MSSSTTPTSPDHASAALDEFLFDNWFDPIEGALREQVRGFIETMIRTELDEALGRARYARSAATEGNAQRPAGHRHGSRTRTLTGSFGTTEIAVAGRWRIVEMDTWSADVIDVGGEAHITFTSAEDGEIAFVAVEAFLDVRYATRDGIATAEFTCEGVDEGDRISGRGWASLGTAGRLFGHVDIHKGEDSGFVCERA